MFRFLGLLIGLYALHAAVTGRVYAKSGPGGRPVLRQQSPEYFWTVIAVYAGLSIALVAWF